MHTVSLVIIAAHSLKIVRRYGEGECLHLEHNATAVTLTNQALGAGASVATVSFGKESSTEKAKRL